MAKVQVLTDYFNNSVVDALKWSAFTAGGATLTFDSTGVTITYPALTDGTTDGDLSSVSAFNMLDSYALMQVLAIPTTITTNSLGLFWYKVDSSNLVGYRFQAGNIVGYKKVAGVSTDIFTATWDSTVHAWIRIREDTRTTYWETSIDGSLNSWVVRWSETNPITLSTGSMVLGGISTGVDANPGTFKFKNFNIKTQGYKFNNRGTRPRLFAPGLAR